jgi:ABC-2 type transport system ATP-binding protein
MAEADELCDRLAIIDKGRILACDSPSSLKGRVQKGSVFLLEVRSDHADWKDKLSGVEGLAGLTHSHDTDTGLTTLRFLLEDDAYIADVLGTLSPGKQGIVSFKKIEPTLEDAFVQVVGHGLQNGEEKDSVAG